MIDCAASEQKAIKIVFDDNAQVLLCYWHLMRAWEEKVKKVGFVRVFIPN